MMSFKIKRLILLLITALLLFSCVSCKKINRTSYASDYNFNDISYTKPDYDLFVGDFDYILENKDNIFAAITVNEKYCEMVEIYDKIVLYDDYLTIREAFKSNDTYVVEQHNYIRRISDDVYDKILLVSKYIRERKCGFFYRLLNSKDSVAFEFPDCSGVYLSDVTSEDTYPEKIANEIYNIDKCLYENTTINGENYTYDYDVPPGLKTKDADGAWILTLDEIEYIYKVGFVSEDTYKQMLFDLYNVKFDTYGSELKSLFINQRAYSMDLGYSFEELQNSQHYTKFTASEVISTGESEIDYLLSLRNELSYNIDDDFVNEINMSISNAFSDEENFTDFIEILFARMDSSLMTKFNKMIETGSCNIYYEEDKKDTSFVQVISMYNKPFLFLNPGESPTIDNFADFLYYFGVYNYLYDSEDIEASLKDKEALEKAGSQFVLSVIEYLGLVFTKKDVAETAKSKILCYLINKSLTSFANVDFENTIAKNKKLDVSTISASYYEILSKYGLNGIISYYNKSLDFMKNECLYKDTFSNYETAIITLNSIKEYYGQ